MSHAILSASASHRWLKCPGSVALSMGMEDSAGESARWGTAAHTVAAWCLESGMQALAYLDRIIEVEGHKYTVDDDMIDMVQTYVDTVLSLVEATGGTLLVEQKVDYSAVLGVQEQFGTADAIILAGDELIVVDLKTGQREVDPTRNTQLMLYALGALEDFGLVADFQRARLMISQPPKRRDPSEWTVDVDTLQAFGAEAARTAKTAMELVYTKDITDEHLVPGDDQCKYCKAKPSCPKLRAEVNEVVFADLDALEGESEPIPAMAPVNPNALARIYNRLDLIEDWCKSIREMVYNQAMLGVEFPGLKLVAGKKGARSWIDDAAAEELMKSMRLKHDEMYISKIVSPTAAEKLLKESPKRWAKLSELVAQPEGKPVLAPVTDKRPAIEVAPVADGFADLSADAADLV